MAGGSYYVPEHSPWPIIASIGLFFTLYGAVHLLHSNHHIGLITCSIGLAIMIFVITRWFGSVVNESLAGLYSRQMDRSFRWGMMWFIFSEIMFFLAFFGALFYARNCSVPTLGGLDGDGLTNLMLWPNFQAAWPLFKNPDPAIHGPHHVIHAFGIPALNTLLLLSSACTLTWAHWALKYAKRGQVIFGLFITILLGSVFLGCQAYEYVIAHTQDGLTLASGIYGSTFFMLTGFHGLHVTVGAIMLTVILFRVLKGHFTADNHFAFEACAWYWHFVDVVWLILFVFVYWI